MHVYAIPTVVIDNRKDIFYAEKVMFESSERIGNRELVVADYFDKNKKIVGCLDNSSLMKAHRNKRILYIKSAYLRSINTCYKASLTLDKTLEVASKGRSLFLIRKQANRKKLYTKDLLAEISIKNVLEMVLKQRSGSRDYSSLLKYPVKV